VNFYLGAVQETRQLFTQLACFKFLLVGQGPDSDGRIRVNVHDVGSCFSEGFLTRAVVLMNSQYFDLPKLRSLGDEDVGPTRRAAKFSDNTGRCSSGYGAA
jgi:hypothetical protein